MSWCFLGFVVEKSGFTGAIPRQRQRRWEEREGLRGEEEEEERRRRGVQGEAVATAPVAVEKGKGLGCRRWRGRAGLQYCF